MLIPASITRRFAPKSPRRGFTLVQMLVAIGITLALIGLLLPAVMRARKSARRTAATMQLQVISTALEAYKLDFDGNYPSVDSSGTVFDSGALALCRLLVAPAPATGSPPDLFDGYEGDGFKIGGVGKTYGPYLRSDQFRIGYAVGTPNGSASLSAPPSPPGTPLAPALYGQLYIADNIFPKSEDRALIGRDGKPIQYCPALKAKPRFNNTNVYFAARKSAVLPGDVCYFDLDKLFGVSTLPEAVTFRQTFRQPGEADETNATLRLRKLLGTDATGKLASGARPNIETPYILWMAGEDGVFGPDASSDKAEADDILFSNAAP